MNKESAEMIKTIEAIKGKMRAKDYGGARALVLEARKAFPGFDQSLEMLTVCDILCAAEVELPGSGLDWYWVLQLLSSATPAEIEVRYKDIMSQLNLIKNDFPGTDLALEFATDAFEVLSDPVKRAKFDSNRNSFQGMSGDSSSGDSSRLKRSASEDFSGNGVDKKQKRKICALEATNTLDNGDVQEALGVSEENHVSRKHRVKDFYDFETARKAECFSEGQIWAAYDQENMPRRFAKIVKIIPQSLQFSVTWFKACPQQSYEKKWQDAGLPVACGKFRLELNKMTCVGPSMLSYMFSNGMNKEVLEVYPRKDDVWAIYQDWDVQRQRCSDPGTSKNHAFHMVEILGDYEKNSGVIVVYLTKVHGLNNVFKRYCRIGNEFYVKIPGNKLFIFSHKVPAFRFVGGELDGILKGMLELDPLATPDDVVQDVPCDDVAIMDSISQSNEERGSSSDASMANLRNHSISMMDSGGSTSDVRRRKIQLTPKDFVQDQIWAVYVGPDAMPRAYVKVNNVTSPTKVSVTFLESHPVLDQEIVWVEEDLPMACGIFRVGKYTSDLEMSKFSHLVHCDRSSKGSYYRIFPREGEVWAIYKNWNINWKSSALKDCQYWVVEILSDFSEENGVRICSLTEVQGYFTFFQRRLQNGFQLTRQLSRLQLLSFSHRIPAFTVIGIKHSDIPKGTLHLEPDALPPK